MASDAEFLVKKTGLLAIHKRLTNTTVKGNNQLAESIMKAIKIESNILLHAAGIAEYFLHVDREMDADVIKAVQQTTQLPARTRKRDRIRASRSKALANVIEEIDEEEESNWSRTPGLEYESNRLRQELKNLEEAEGRVVCSQTYKSIYGFSRSYAAPICALNMRMHNRNRSRRHTRCRCAIVAFGITTSIIKDRGDDGRHQSKQHRTCHTNRDGSCSIDEKEILHELRERNYEILLQ